MAYCTLQDLIDRYGEAELVQRTDRAGIGLIDQAVVDQAIADAGAEIDGYLDGRYALPLAVTPQILRLYACDLVRFRLHAELAGEEVSKRYELALKFLRLVAEGKIRFGAGPEEPPASAQAEFAASRRVMSGGGY